MKSFGILRTNTGLTTNVKIVVDSSYGLSLDSIDSTPELSLSKYKKLDFNKDSYLDEIIPYFYDGLPADTAFTIKYDDDSETMSTDFASQYDELYQYGARNIVDNKNYIEEYEYFAPLYIHKGLLPTNFIIFRVDGPGIENINRFNFRTSILDKLKVVKVFDLGSKTTLGYWLNKNITDNNFFPTTPFEMNYERLEFSLWNGIEYKNGGYVSKALFLDDTLESEKEIFEMEKFILDGYRNNKVIFPNILNMSFLFDDTPATENSIRKWSMNRYYGFYLEDMEKVSTISPYVPPMIKSDVVILEGNILYSETGDPFVNGWSENIPFWVEHNGEYYKVQKFTEQLLDSFKPVSTSTIKQQPKTTAVQKKNGIVSSTVVMVDPGSPLTPNYISDQSGPTFVDKWRIISDINLTDRQSYLNTNSGFIGTDKILYKTDGSKFQIVDMDRADVWIMEIDGIFHRIIMTNDGIKILTDYGFEFGQDTFIYYVNKLDPKYTTKVSFLVDDKNPPKYFQIYRLKFSDIKDFDTRIVETESSKFEYDKSDEVINTDESKLYLTNLNSETNPPQLDDFRYKDKVVNIPVSSEYTANQETFKIDNGLLSPIWRKNPVYCRWAFSGSISANDYPYLLNNSNKFEDFNRTVNPFDPDPSRSERNLDWFYTINSSTYSYSHHSLHIEKINEYGIDFDFDFDFNKYLGTAEYISATGSSVKIDYDYFSSLLTMKKSFSSGENVITTKKYSVFQSGDKNTPNITLFRGIKLSIFDVQNVKLDQTNQIQVVNTTNKNTFEGWKFSTILTKMDNGMQWDPIDRWEMDVNYIKGDIVSWEDILYIASVNTICKSPVTTDGIKSAPYNLDDWELYSDINDNNLGSVMWNPNNTYKNNDVIYRNNNYYYVQDITKSHDFWNPNTTYGTGSVVLHNDNFYISLSNNKSTPDNTSYWSQIKPDWTNSKWQNVEVWAPNKQYGTQSLVVSEGVLYKSDGNLIPSGANPKTSGLWVRLYGMESDTNYVYSPNDNPLIIENGEYYRIVSNPKSSTLENGIKVYINHKYKNILVNIYINDNTVGDLRDVDRDVMYKSLNKKLTANNFINCINNLGNKYGFSDYLSYVIIDANGTISTYDMSSGITNLPYMLFAEVPTEIGVKVNSLEFLPSSQPKLKPSKILVDGNITTLKQLNYFNNTHLATEIITNNDTPLLSKNYSGQTSIAHNRIYRFSGNYMPLFYDIELFNKDNGILHNTMDLSLEISNPQVLTFRINNNGSSKDVLYTINPGASYSTANQYWKQIIDIINLEFPGIEFNYEIVNKSRKTIGDLINLDETSFGDVWYDTSRNGCNAIPTPYNYSPKLVQTDIYPGGYVGFTFSSSSKLDVYNGINISSNTTFEFMIRPYEVDSYNTFMYDGNITFGFEDGRVFMSTNNTNAVYSDSLLQKNTWYNITFTHREENGISYESVYIDGENRTTTDSTSLTYTPTSQYTGVISKYGSNPTISNPTYGIDISSIRIYSRSLEQNEIYSNFVSEHGHLRIRYKESIGKLGIEIIPDQPKLSMEIYDAFDPLLTNYTLSLGATGGNPPYKFSVNGGQFDYTTLYPSISKGTTMSVIVKDVLGLTSSVGQYLVNNVIEYPYTINGTFVYG